MTEVKEEKVIHESVLPALMAAVEFHRGNRQPIFKVIDEAVAELNVLLDEAERPPPPPGPMLPPPARPPRLDQAGRPRPTSDDTMTWRMPNHGRLYMY